MGGLGRRCGGRRPLTGACGGQSSACSPACSSGTPKAAAAGTAMCAVCALSLGRSALGRGFPEAAALPHTGCVRLQCAVLSVPGEAFWYR